MAPVLTIANTSLDGTGEVGRALIFTAPDSGCPWPRIEISPQGTNIANLVRIFSNNGGDPENPKNNKLIAEIGTPAWTKKKDPEADGPKTVLDFSYAGILLPGYRIFATLAHATAGGLLVEAKQKTKLEARIKIFDGGG
jgi:hypothetical protein